jgi:hypothetical protein
MGYYIQTDGRHGKADYLVKKYGAVKLDRAPREWTDIPLDKALIAVVDNGPFEAAGVAVDERDFSDFTTPDHRPITYLLMDYELAVQLANVPIKFRSPRHNQ